MALTLAERLNNAIVKLDWEFPAKPAGAKQAVVELAQHWLSFWDSSERALLSPALLFAKLERYAQWYARAYALAPAATRAKVPHPRDLDASLLAAVEDQLNYMAEGAQAAAEAGIAVAAFAKEQAQKLKEEITEGLDKALDTLVIAAVVVIGGALAWGWMEKQKRGHA